MGPTCCQGVELSTEDQSVSVLGGLLVTETQIAQMLFFCFCICLLIKNNRMLLRWTSVVCFFCPASHEPRPRGDPDSCASAFPAIPHHPLPGSISVGSLHTYYNAPHCPCGATTAATPLEGKGACGQRTWGIESVNEKVWKPAHTHKLSIPAHQNQPSAPISVLANQTVEYTSARRTLPAAEQPVTIVILLIYRSLGEALPPKYHTDRRGVRWDSIILWTIIIIIIIIRGRSPSMSDSPHLWGTSEFLL